MTREEIDQVNHNGALLFSIVSRKVKLEKSGSTWKGLCPLHDEKSPSFHVYPDGHFNCFGCGAHGTSFNFVMELEHVEFPEAAERIAAEIGSDGAPPKKPNCAGNGADHSETWLPMVPPPAEAPKPDTRQLKCDMLHEYPNADDRLLCYVRRFEAKGDKRKEFLPLTYGTLTKDGRTVIGWHTKAPDAPRPLYGLNRLSHAAPDATVLLCEGEKAADAAQRLFPDHVCLSWMGGAKADASADFSPLHGRRVIGWGDADQTGRDAIASIAKRLPLIGTIDTEGLPDGFDAWDLERGGCDDPAAWLEARLRDPPPRDECTLAELEAKQFEPIKWIVQDYIPEGLTVFAGRPKIGKSWLMLGVSLGVARGTEALGKFVQKGDVFYCGLEDGDRRMRSRVEKILGPEIKGWPANFTFRHKLDPIDAGGLDTIEQWLNTHPARRLVVIDTLGRVRGMKNAREEQYQYDYRLIGSLQVVATRYGVAIVAIHHVRKTDADDVLDTVSGTTGIAGAADTVIVLGKTEHGARMYLRGRDAEEQDKLVEFDPDTAIWSVAGDYDEAAPGPGQGLRKQIIEMLAGSPVALTPLQIAKRLNTPHATIKQMLRRMATSDPPQVARGSQFGSYVSVT